MWVVLFALRLAKYDDEIPQIGQVVDLDELDVTVEWWIGRYADTWKCWKDKKGVPIQETFPKTAVLQRVIFTKSLRLNTSVKEELKIAYENVEFI